MGEKSRRRLFGPLLYITLAITAIVGLYRALEWFGPLWPVEYESVDQLPVSFLASVREAAPGYEPKWISKLNWDMTVAYRIWCLDRQGKKCTVFISESGKILKVEEGER